MIEVVLAQVETSNAVDGQMHTELARVFEELAADSQSDIIIISGAGGVFSSGSDPAWLKRVAEGAEPPPSAEDAKRIVYGLINLPKPIIAKVRGPCIGLAAIMVLLCDAVFADRSAQFADPHVRAGLAAGNGGAIVWPLIVGPVNAKRLLLSGDAIGAGEAQRLGLVSDLIDAGQLDSAVDAYAMRLAGGALTAIRNTKDVVNMHLRHWADQILDKGLGAQLSNIDTADHREAVIAFFEKRAPKFTGS